MLLGQREHCDGVTSTCEAVFLVFTNNLGLVQRPAETRLCSQSSVKSHNSEVFETNLEKPLKRKLIQAAHLTFKCPDRCQLFDSSQSQRLIDPIGPEEH